MACHWLNKMHPSSWRQQRPLYLLYLLAFPLGMLLVQFKPPTGATICPFRLLTHLDCPACGLTRAFYAMGRLDLVEASRYNPLGPALAIAALVLWGYTTIMVLTGGRVALPHWWQRWQPRLLRFALVLFLAMGIGRTCYELRHPPSPPTVPAVHLGWPVPGLYLRK